MKLYHVTKKENLESIKQNGLLKAYHLKQSQYPDTTSGEAIYLSTNMNGNNLPINLYSHDLISLEIDLSSLSLSLIRPDDGIYWAYGHEEMFVEDDLDEVRSAFGLSTNEEAMSKLEILEELEDHELVDAFKDLGMWYLNQEGEIAYLGDIDFNLIKEVHYL